LKVVPTSESGKLDQLIEKLEEENVIVKSEEDDDPKCALVFSQFNGMVEMIATALRAKGVPAETITGATSKKKRDEVIAAFTEQGEGAPRVLVMNTMAGTALNLSQADSVHMMDETWVPDNQEQAEDRAHRGDERTMAKDHVRIYYYRSRLSIEEYIRQLVADKQLNNKTILDIRRKIQKELREAEAKEEARA
jgi:SNF2 family DNA or RNA helicase